jgi:hypothetical protein
LGDVGDVPFAFGAGDQNVRHADEALTQIVRQGSLVIGGRERTEAVAA